MANGMFPSNGAQVQTADEPFIKYGRLNIARLKRMLGLGNGGDGSTPGPGLLQKLQLSNDNAIGQSGPGMLPIQARPDRENIGPVARYEPPVTETDGVFPLPFLPQMELSGPAIPPQHFDPAQNPNFNNPGMVQPEEDLFANEQMWPLKTTIQRGDTLSALGKKHGLSVAQLMAMNPDIKDANMIQAGASLTLDPGAALRPDGGLSSAIPPRKTMSNRQIPAMKQNLAGPPSAGSGLSVENMSPATSEPMVAPESPLDEQEMLRRMLKAGPKMGGGTLNPRKLIGPM